MPERISDLETRRYELPLDPPFIAAWDPEPRTSVVSTITIVRSDDGTVGFASGDDLPDVDRLRSILVGVDPLRTEIVHELCETVDTHGGRPWCAEVAIWDLVGRLLDLPLWRLLGGRQERLIAYASTGEVVEPEERVQRVKQLVEEGFRAVKIRFHQPDWRRDVEVVRAIREGVGGDLAIMVDANHGWRMPGDRSPRWDLATAASCARALEQLDVYWLEEPLADDHVEGYAALRRITSIRLAAGEMVRRSAQARDLIVRGGVGVIQPDAVLAGGITGCRRVAATAHLHGRMFSPHTWSNGLGLLANLHLALAVSTCPYIEVPYDPPAWTPERRDALLPEPIRVAPDGTLAAPDGPGLGAVPDLDALEAFRIA